MWSRIHSYTYIWNKMHVNLSEQKNRSYHIRKQYSFEFSALHFLKRKFETASIYLNPSKNILTQRFYRTKECKLHYRKIVQLRIFYVALYQKQKTKLSPHSKLIYVFVNKLTSSEGTSILSKIQYEWRISKMPSSFKLNAFTLNFFYNKSTFCKRKQNGCILNWVFPEKIYVSMRRRIWQLLF